MEKLNLTPEQILDTEFKIDFKGYSAEEVDAFLDLILDDYYKMEDNVQELLDYVSSLQDEVKELNRKNIELQGKQKAFDIPRRTPSRKSGFRACARNLSHPCNDKKRHRRGQHGTCRNSGTYLLEYGYLGTEKNNPR